MRLAPLLVGAWLALLPAAWSLELQLQAERGLEDHSSRLLARQVFDNPRDSLNLELRVEWRAGFRDYNRDSRRLLEQLQLDGTRRLEGPWRLRWTARQALFNERRSLRETLGSSLDAGLRWAGPLDLELLGGWMQDRRQTGYDSGPRLRAGALARTREAGWQLEGQGAWQAERPGQRRNSRAEVDLRARWRGPEDQSDEARLQLSQQREDAFPDPRQESLERRKTLQMRVENRFRGRLWEGGRYTADLAGWNESQDRRPRESADSLGGSMGSSLDRGLEVRAEPVQRLGALEAALSFTLRRQSQEAEYGNVGRLSRTLSRIALNRLETRLLWRPARDSLFALGVVELRRRDSDFVGPARRDPDYTDQARRDLRLRWSHSWRPGARLGLEGGLTLNTERHLQSSRSGSNYLNRTWRAGADHRVGLGAFQTTGGGALVADYRLYDFDDPDEPRSWIQRRLQWEERVRRDLWQAAGARGAWRLAWEGRGRWMEEDGGSFARRDGRERISDSAREWGLTTSLDLRHGTWTLRPGWSWQRREDWRWNDGSGTCNRRQVRDLARQGPQLLLGRESRRSHFSLDLQWEQVSDRGLGEAIRRHSLRARLEWSWRAG